MDIKESIVSINHTLVYYNHAKSVDGAKLVVILESIHQVKQDVKCLCLIFKRCFITGRKNQFSTGVRCCNCRWIYRFYFC